MKNLINYFDDIDIRGLKDYVLCEVLDECAESTANRATAANTMGMGNPKMPTEDGEAGTEPLHSKTKSSKKSKIPKKKKSKSEEE